jgi:HEAT repeat protein
MSRQSNESKSVDHFIQLLASEHAHDRNEATSWLLEHASESRPALTRLVSKAVPDQRTLAAIFLLGRMANEEDVPLLAASLTRRGLEWESAQALGHHCSKSAREALLQALAHEDLEVVGGSVIALGGCKDESTRKPLEKLLGHHEESVRYRVVLALMQLGVNPSLEVLKMHYAHEPSSEVRHLIEKALADTG